jgi:uncharacterized membrane protein
MRGECRRECRFVMRPRAIAAALSLCACVACQERDSSRRPDSAGAAGADSGSTSVTTAADPETPSAGPWRLIGTEPFWALDIDSTGLRFKTPDDTMGIHWPPLTPVVRSDTLRWLGETERAAVEVRIWPGRCSDGMSDRVWPYEAAVRVERTNYRGCAESRARPQPADVLEGNWHVVGHHAPGIAAMSAQEADGWVGRKARFSRSIAQFGKNACPSPTYETRNLTDQAFAQEFRVQSTDLGLRSPIQMVEVRCAGSWDGPGNRLLVKGPNELLTLWDGVFFELRRD